MFSIHRSNDIVASASALMAVCSLMVTVPARAAPLDENIATSYTALGSPAAIRRRKDERRDTQGSVHIVHHSGRYQSAGRDQQSRFNSCGGVPSQARRSSSAISCAGAPDNEVLERRSIRRTGSDIRIGQWMRAPDGN
jgi:hypothetical protein